MAAITPQVPNNLVKRLVWVNDAARLNALHIMGGPGSGKSRLMGRAICWLDFLRGIPQIILDPTGGTWANFCDKLLHLSPVEQKRAAARVIYVDMSGSGSHIIPFPLYYRLTPQESLYAITQRPLEVFRRIDPHLMSASVEGWNSLSRLGTYAGMLLASLDYQITEAASLIRTPETWHSRFSQALRHNPEVKPAVDFFCEFMDWPPEQRIRRADALLIKLLPFAVDPSMAALFGTATGRLDWDEVVARGQTVVLDFSREINPERRRFKLLWLFLSVVDFLKSRGLAGRRQPIAFVIDEVTQLLGYGSAEQSLLAADLEELASVIARNYGVWLTIAHQSLAQIDERIRHVLMQMGTQIIGVTPDPDDAFYLARQFTHYDPLRVKKREPIWMGVADPTVMHPISEPTIIDWRTVEFSADEQFLLMAQRFRTQRRFQFLVRTAQGEGEIAGMLRSMSIRKLDRNRYPDLALVAQAEQRLMRHRGTAVADILAEVAKRLQVAQPYPPTPPKPAVTIKDHGHALPLFTQTPQPQEDEDDDDETFRDPA